MQIPYSCCQALTPPAWRCVSCCLGSMRLELRPGLWMLLDGASQMPALQGSRRQCWGPGRGGHTCWPSGSSRWASWATPASASAEDPIASSSVEGHANSILALLEDGTPALSPFFKSGLKEVRVQQAAPSHVGACICQKIMQIAMQHSASTNTHTYGNRSFSWLCSGCLHIAVVSLIKST